MASRGNPRHRTAASSASSKRASQAKNAIYPHSLPVQPSDPSSSLLGYIFSFFYAQSSSSSPKARQNQQQSAALVHPGDPHPVCIGFFDALTNSVWVQDPKDAMILWRRGFFGKGSLSRSEPTWKSRKVASLTGNREGLAAEELTAQRRAARKAMKIERARAAVRAGTQLADGIIALGGDIEEEEIPKEASAGTSEGAGQAQKKLEEERIEAEAERELREEDEAAAAAGGSGRATQSSSALGTQAAHRPGLLRYRDRDGEVVPDPAALDIPLELEEGARGTGSIDVVDMEHLQLSLNEALFLAGFLGALEVRDDKGDALSIEQLYTLCLLSSIPPPLRDPSLSADWFARPDNSFLVNYVAYHHFRSLGWVVKSGIKFCVDLLLYKRGPVFHHAEFAILILPVYEDPADEESSPFPPHPNGGAKSWIWLSTMNRVNSQVQKTLILCHVHIPAISRTPPEALSSPQSFVQNLKEGNSYSVREVSIRRWVPARMRA